MPDLTTGPDAVDETPTSSLDQPYWGAVVVDAPRGRTHRRSLRLRPGRIALYAAVAAGAVVMMFPFLWTVITSITPNGSLSGGPTLFVDHPTLDAYVTLFARLPMARIVMNSLLVALVSTCLQLLTGSMAGYAFARLDFPGKPVVFGFYPRRRDDRDHNRC